ncbi:Aste57867_13368 [Aphanomyces stellatus]|uniref:Aste57867_13368 protein n=1 Tax=Aphanomyces stellatus TaxID=120398 RepID=A0A485KZN4_9STRA|nr:hypothetical protein As57867_013318 [Aphanomyces stellatus]VFT90207.1 Aste57867_13368 [Aphanomyces stellatus]
MGCTQSQAITHDAPTPLGDTHPNECPSGRHVYCGGDEAVADVHMSTQLQQHINPQFVRAIIEDPDDQARPFSPVDETIVQPNTSLQAVSTCDAIEVPRALRLKHKTKKRTRQSRVLNSLLISRDAAPTPSEVLAAIHSIGDARAIDEQDVFGRTLLHYAAVYGHTELMEMLLNELAIQVDVVDAQRNTALHLAASRGCVKQVQILLAHGASTTALNMHLQSPLLVALYAAERIRFKQRNDDGNINFNRVVSLLWETTSTSVLTVRDRYDVSAIKLERIVFGDFIDAARKGLVQRLEHLLESGKVPDINMTYRELGRSALHEACDRGQEAAADILIARGIDGGLQDCRGTTALHVATTRGHAKLVDRITQAFPAATLIGDVNGYTAFHLAILHKQSTIAMAMIQTMPEAIKRQDVFGRTPLHLACLVGDTMVAMALLSKGADPTVQIWTRPKQLQRCRHVRRRGPHLIGLFWKRGLGETIAVPCPIEALLVGWANEVADDADFMELFRRLLIRGAWSRDARDCRNRPLAQSLVTALCAKPDVVIRCLEELDTHQLLALEAQDAGGDTLLLHECKRVCRDMLDDGASLSIVRCLVNLGANVNIANAAAQSPLSCATFYGHTALVQLLLDIPTTSLTGAAALHMACLGGHVHLVELLLDHGAPIDGTDDDETPLFLAIRSCKYAVVACLLLRGADANAIRPILPLVVAFDQPYRLGGRRSKSEMGSPLRLVLRLASPVFQPRTYDIVPSFSDMLAETDRIYTSKNELVHREVWQSWQAIGILLVTQLLAINGSPVHVDLDDVTLAAKLGFWSIVESLLLLLGRQMSVSDAPLCKPKADEEASPVELHAIHYASAAGQTSIVAALVQEHNVSPNLQVAYPIRNATRRYPTRPSPSTVATPLAYAYTRGHMVTTAKLLLQGATLPISMSAIRWIHAGWPAWRKIGYVVRGCKTRREDTLPATLLLQYVECHARDPMVQETLVHVVAQRGDTVAMQTLVDAGAKLDVLNSRNQLASMVAAQTVDGSRMLQFLWPFLSDAHKTLTCQACTRCSPVNVASLAFCLQEPQHFEGGAHYSPAFLDNQIIAAHLLRSANIPIDISEWQILAIVLHSKQGRRCRPLIQAILPMVDATVPIPIVAEIASTAAKYHWWPLVHHLLDAFAVPLVRTLNKTRVDSQRLSKTSKSVDKLHPPTTTHRIIPSKLTTQRQSSKTHVKRRRSTKKALSDVLEITKRSVLHEAIIGRELDLIKRLLQQGWELTRDVNGQSALHYAVHLGDMTLLEVFQTHLAPAVLMASLNEADSKGHTPLHEAAMRGHVDVVNTLLAAGANATLRSHAGWSPLALAAKYNHEAVVQRLVTQELPLEMVETTPIEKESILLVAAKHGAFRVVRWLLECTLPGTNVGLADDGKSLVHFAALYNQVPALLTTGTRALCANMRDSHGYLPMHYAFMLGHIDAMDALLSDAVEMAKPIQHINGEPFDIAMMLTWNPLPGPGGRTKSLLAKLHASGYPWPMLFAPYVAPKSKRRPKSIAQTRSSNVVPPYLAAILPTARGRVDDTPASLLGLLFIAPSTHVFTHAIFLRLVVTNHLVVVDAILTLRQDDEGSPRVLKGIRDAIALSERRGLEAMSLRLLQDAPGPLSIVSSDVSTTSPRKLPAALILAAERGHCALLNAWFERESIDDESCMMLLTHAIACGQLGLFPLVDPWLDDSTDAFRAPSLKRWLQLQHVLPNQMAIEWSAEPLATPWAVENEQQAAFCGPVEDYETIERLPREMLEVLSSIGCIDPLPHMEPK